jgi:glycosyltransferase involved in cell wall biosynthesis
MSNDAQVINPLVSVIVPAFRAAPYVGEAVASVFRQTWRDFEILLVNDGSPDTDDLERAIEPYRDRIVYIEQENRGPGGARNTAISRARGEFLAFLDSDDVWLPHYLVEQIGALQLDASLDFIYADAVLFGQSALVGKTYMATSPSHGPVTFESLLNRDCMVITTCTVVRTQAVIDAGGFDEDRFLAPCEDLDLWIRLAYNGCRMTYQRRVLARHRLHSTSLIGDDELRLWTAQIRVLRKAAETLTLAPSARETIARRILVCEAEHALASGKRSLDEGRFDEALEALERANSFFRSRKLSAVMLCLRHAPHLLHTTFEVRNKAWEALAPSRNVLRRLALRRRFLQFQSRQIDNDTS